jgi:hypothetical protein
MDQTSAEKGASEARRAAGAGGNGRLNMPDAVADEILPQDGGGDQDGTEAEKRERLSARERIALCGHAAQGV